MDVFVDYITLMLMVSGSLVFEYVWNANRFGSWHTSCR